MSDQGIQLIDIDTRSLLASEGKRHFEGYLARPASGAGPGLVIFTEMWGVAPSKTEMAEDYAANGWCALAPNMFWRSEFTGVVPFDQADKAWQRLNAFDWARAVDDARTAVQWLRASPHCNGKIAAIGFCMGGRIAFLAVARRRRRRRLALCARHRQASRRGRERIACRSSFTTG